MIDGKVQAADAILDELSHFWAGVGASGQIGLAEQFVGGDIAVEVAA